MFKFTLQKNKNKAEKHHRDNSVMSSCISSIRKVLNRENTHPIFKSYMFYMTFIILSVYS